MTQHCDRANCAKVAVGFIPMPASEKHIVGLDGELIGTGKKLADINVCERHFRIAESRLFLVIRHGEAEESVNVGHEARINEKHRRVVGSDALRVENKTGRWKSAPVRAAA
jgi:hypothetical protein